MKKLLTTVLFLIIFVSEISASSTKPSSVHYVQYKTTLYSLCENYWYSNSLYDFDLDVIFLIKILTIDGNTLYLPLKNEIY